MQFLGPIIQLQVQQSHMKIIEKGVRVYHTAPLKRVSSLRITPKGVIGRDSKGETIIDVHHHDHPQSRNRSDNDISLGFSSHYNLLRERFGAWIENGIAGENILIDVAERVHPRQLMGAIIIESKQNAQKHRLEALTPAPPCVEFSQYLAQSPLSSSETKAILQYLDDGVRGYYARSLSESVFEITLGDLVYIA